MGEIYEYTGELAWTEGCTAVPMLIRSLKVKVPEQEIYVDFSSQNDPFLDRKNYYSGAVYAHRRNRFERRLASKLDWDDWEPIYVASGCWPYGIHGSKVLLEWRIKELHDASGKAYCYVQAHWIENDDEDSQIWRCAGLLTGESVQVFTLPKNIEESDSDEPQ